MTFDEEEKTRRNDKEMETELDIVSLDESDEDILDKTLSASFTEEIEPILPSMESVNSLKNENKKEKDSRSEEMKFRLTSALKKLEQFEKPVGANTSLDYSVTNMKDDFAGTAEKLPSRVEDDVKGIILSAEDYIAKLKDQLGDLDVADEQIVKNTRKVMQEIDDTYQELMDRICHEINKKRDLMRLEAEVYKNESLGPLKACRQEVNAQIRSSRNFVVELSKALADTTTKKPQEYKILEASSHLGRIPAVPQPEELPYVTFSPPSKNVIDTTLKGIFQLGNVLRMGPAQIVEIEERPGSVFVKWHIADPEYASEEQNFILQKANGEIYDVTSNAFETIYEGPENSCFVRNLRINSPVTLRVGLQSVESAWSVHRFAKTQISPYSWSTENKDYMITNDGKVAAKITDGRSTLFSQSPQVDANQIIEFKFLEVSQDGNNNEGIALISETTDNEDDLKKYGSLLITPTGKIFMDGEEKLMRLPRLRLGARIIFSIERKDDETLRINVESGEKAVTYDWTVQTPLYFAARFRDSNRWNFMVK